MCVSVTADMSETTNVDKQKVLTGHEMKQVADLMTSITSRTNGLFDVHVVPKQQAMNGTAHSKGIHAPTPRATLLHLNAPEGLSV